MTQRQITSFIATGVVPDCLNCRKPPKHYFDSRAARIGGGHFFECCACDARTGRHSSPEKTNREWCQRNGYTPRTGTPTPVSQIKRVRG